MAGTSNSEMVNLGDKVWFEDIDECLADLISGKTEISRRNWVFIKILKIKGKTVVIRKKDP